MLRYRYNRQVSPPAPFIHIECEHPLGSSERLTLPALLDTGADLSTIPPESIEHLGLVQLDEIPVASYRGETMLAPSYLIRLDVGSWQMGVIEVIASGEEYAILGPDVLNQFRIVLDGPSAIVELRKDDE